MAMEGYKRIDGFEFFTVTDYITRARIPMRIDIENKIIFTCGKTYNYGGYVYVKEDETDLLHPEEIRLVDKETGIWCRIWKNGTMAEPAFMERVDEDGRL